MLETNIGTIESNIVLIQKFNEFKYIIVWHDKLDHHWIHKDVKQVFE